MSSLFEISADLMRLTDMLDDPEIEVDDQAIMDTWEGLEGEFNDKVESWLKVIRNKQADFDSRKAFIDQQRAKNDSDKKTIDRMKATLMSIMQMQNIKTAGTAVLKATVAGNGGKMPLIWEDDYKDNPSKLPEEYRVEETVYSANQDEIRKALDEGKELPFVKYGERGSHLNIK